MYVVLPSLATGAITLARVLTDVDAKNPTQGSVSPRLKGRAVLVFQGVDSAFHVWVNGLPVGFAKGSRLPCEFDVTDALRGTGEQSLSLRVVRWSDGSYLEDQDHWWLSGVYREVELALRPSPTRILDFVVRCGSSAGFSSRKKKRSWGGIAGPMF